ncbi:molybdopterin oxidoreductase [Hymenobacter wooponensis]|uniref:Molybdopterin oxidoreductase n=1 Tax=Hymenobacter wooponensis TaxID=1525360 RepID=A0A4Z0MS18_9BACT|nr:molybdopterin oxidoreductase [Hymenobacter wooponensis]TGD82249.1 molybdopterin oxidoreductase [Hymenobacter wooponensis]
MQLPHYLGLLENSEKQLMEAFEYVADKHKDEPDIEQMCQKLSAWSREHHGRTQAFVAKYSEEKEDEPDKLKRELFAKKRKGSLALLRDLHDLWLLTQEVHLCWVVIRQAALGLRDEDLKACYEFCNARTQRQADWLLSRIKQAAPQTLLVAE